MRSRSRRTCRSRSESQQERIARSPSRTLYEEGTGGVPPEVPRLIKQQQYFLVELLTEHKQEVEAKLQSKQTRFTSKPLEKQYDVNADFKELTEKAQAALKGEGEVDPEEAQEEDRRTPGGLGHC